MQSVLSSFQITISQPEKVTDAPVSLLYHLQERRFECTAKGADVRL